MADPAKVVLKIISVKGTCAAGHKVGQEFDLGKEIMVGYTEDGKALCPSAYHAAFPSWPRWQSKGYHPPRLPSIY